MQNLSKKNLMHAAHQVEALKRRYRSAVAKSEETIEHIVHGVESFGSAFAFGVLQGRFANKGGIGVMGVPLELAVGVAGYVAAAAGIGGTFAEHLYPLAQGAISSYATTLGRGVGMKMLQSSGAMSTTSPSASIRGDAPGALAGEATLSAAELDALSHPA